MQHQVKPKLFFITAGLPQGGAETFLASIMNSIDRKGANLSLINLGTSENTLKLFKPGFVYKKFARKKRFDVGPLLSLRKWIRKEQPDVIFCINYFTFVFARLATLFMACKSKFIISYHSTIHVDQKDHRLHKIFTRMVRDRDELIMITKEQMAYTAAHYHVPSGPVRVIYNGVDTDYWTMPEASFNRNEFRKTYGIGVHDQVIVLTATFRPEKNHQGAIEALEILHEKFGKKAVLVFAGGGQRMRQIKELAEKSPISSHIVFTGYVPDIREVYWMSDLFALTSNRVETFSIAALEAMSCGLPAVITNIGGATEMIFDGENGFLTETDGESIAATWAKAMDHVFSNVKIRELIKEKFNLTRMTAEYKEVLGIEPTHLRDERSHSATDNSRIIVTSNGTARVSFQTKESY